MNGTIIFQSIEDLAEFLKAFTGSTAAFEVRYNYAHEAYELEFKGGF